MGLTWGDPNCRLGELRPGTGSADVVDGLPPGACCKCLGHETARSSVPWELSWSGLLPARLVVESGWSISSAILKWERAKELPGPVTKLDGISSFPSTNPVVAVTLQTHRVYQSVSREYTSRVLKPVCRSRWWLLTVKQQPQPTV